MVKAHAISGRFYLGLNHSHDDEVATSGIRQEGGAVVLMNCPGFLSKGEKDEVQNPKPCVRLEYQLQTSLFGWWRRFFFRLQQRWLQTVFVCYFQNFQMCCCFCQKAMIPNKNCDLQAHGIWDHSNVESRSWRDSDVFLFYPRRSLHSTNRSLGQLWPNVALGA